MPDTQLPVLPLASTLHSGVADLLRSVTEAYWEQERVKLIALDPTAILAERAHALLVLTGGTEGEALAFAERSRGPIVLLSHPGHNSLPAALEIAARLGHDDRAARLVHLGGRRGSLGLLATAIALARSIAEKKIGLVGVPSPWLIASTPEPPLLTEKLGLTVRSYPLDVVLSRLPAEGSATVEGRGVGVGDDERAMASRVSGALRRLVEDDGLDAISVACFALLPHRMTACWALSSLSDAGIPGGCEGDLPAALALIVAQELTGGPGFLANPADADLKRGTLTLAHCTVPLSLTTSYALRTHFESGLGLAIAGRLRPGPYTLVRFGGVKLERGFFVEGTVLAEDVGRNDLCRTQVRFKMPRGAIERLLDDPLGNHHVLIPGHHRAILTEFRDLFLAP